MSEVGLTIDENNEYNIRDRRKWVSKNLINYEKLLNKQQIIYFSPHWKSMIVNWARIVSQIHNAKCSICGVKRLSDDGKSTLINAHHIYPKEDYPQYALDIWNGMMLCPDHHKKAHILYKKHGIKEYLKELELIIIQGKT